MQDFSFLVAKIKSHVSAWKGKLLNKAGRMTHARSLLSSMPVYNTHTTWILQSVCEDIDKAIRNFLWRADERRKGLNLVLGCCC